MGIILPFYKPVSPLVPVATPWLDGERLILVILVSDLLVGFFEQILDDFGGGERPEDQGFEKSELSGSSSAD